MRASSQAGFDDRAGFHAAVLQVLACCRRSIVVVDADLSGWPFESADGEAALRAALARGAQMRLLLRDPGWLERHGNRFMRLRRGASERIACRRLPEALRIDDCALLGDRQHLVHRAHADTLRGRWAIAVPELLENLQHRLDAAWDEATPCLPSTVLGLAR